MKATRKLIPAIAMLLISAVMMSTATYAWFITNSNVAVNNLTVTAKSASTYLIIDNVYDSAKDDNGKDEFTTGDYHTTYINWAGDVPELVPVTFNGTSWYYGTGTSIDNGTLSGSQQPVAENALSGVYALKVTYRMRIADGFPFAKDLKLTEVAPATGTGTNYNEVVGVVAKCGDNYNYLVYDATTSAMKLENTTALASSVEDQTILVDVYVFIDGNHPNVKTANASYLHDLIVSLTFSVGELDSSN